MARLYTKMEIAKHLHVSYQKLNYWLGKMPEQLQPLKLGNRSVYTLEDVGAILEFMACDIPLDADIKEKILN